MPMAAYAIWLAFIGDNDVQTDIIHGTRYNGRETAEDEAKYEHVKQNPQIDEVVQDLAAKCISESGIDQAKDAVVMRRDCHCAVCTKVLLVIHEDRQAQQDRKLPTPEVVPGGHRPCEGEHLQTEGYGLVVNFIDSLDGWRVSFDHCAHVSSSTADEGARLLERALRTLSAQIRDKAQAKPYDEGLLSIYDVYDIWSWNAVVPAAIEACVHDLFADVAAGQPEAPAICAWDGDFTYRELDELSTQLARYLVSTLDVGPGTLIPLCFEKSRWTPVAMLGVMKAGAASVLTDTSHPEARLRSIVQQAHTNSKQHIILSSQKSEALSRRLADDSWNGAVVTPEAILQEPIDAFVLSRVKVRSEDLLYVVFTSGSTGTPKGAMITHGNFTSAIYHQKNTLGYRQTSRVFDFVSYAFDVAWSNALHTLTSGGCLCIPNDSDRKGDIGRALNSLRATDAHLTPTVAQLMRPEDVPGLTSIMFIGEKLNQSDLMSWRRVPNVRNTYGPAECTVTNTIMTFPDDMAGIGEPSIGRGSGTVTWVVSLDGNELTAVGEPGELWLEGPLIGQGYLANPSKTAEVFIQDPPWLLRGAPGTPGMPAIPGRHGLLYRTGDLVRYNIDGTLQFLGRKDDQVKIRGQRVELGDIEHHLRQCLTSYPDIGVVAEVARPSGSTDPLLVAFMTIGAAADGTQEEVRAALGTITEKIYDKVADYLTTYMIPAAYIPLRDIPVTGTGKTDRRRLREIIAGMTLDQLADLSPDRPLGPYEEPTTAAERELQQLWAAILGMESKRISANDNFFRIGGDSVSAMRLVAAARDQGLTFSTADVFRCPQLIDLAKTVSAEVQDVEHAVPFSLLGTQVDRRIIQSEAAAACQISVDEVLDAYPCTELQKGLMALTETSNSGAYIAQKVFRLGSEVKLHNFRQAWKHVVSSNDILRTRIVDLPEHGLLQVVCSDAPIIEHVRSLADYLAEGRNIRLGSALSYAVLIEDDQSGCQYLVWTVHHAIYDGWSVSLLLDSINRAYNGDTVSSGIMPFHSFVKFISELDLPAAAEYWKSELEGCKAATYPALPSPTYQPYVDQTTHRRVSLTWPKTGITPSNILRSAWAVLQARNTDSSDVLFGTVVTGRQAPMPGISGVVGPTISTVPVRVKIDHNARSLEFQEKMQSQSIEMLPFEQFGLSRIRGLGEVESAVADFQSLLVIQPRDDEETRRGSTILMEVRSESTNDLEQLNTYGLTAVCHLHDQGFDLDLNFDGRLFATGAAKRMAEQLEAIVQQLCNNEDAHMKVSDLISVISKQDQIDIWAWNATIPEAIDACVHELFIKVAKQQPDAPAICAWDGAFTYGELDALSSTLAGHLIHMGAGPGTIIPLCFEKSKWTPVAMLGVMKAGAASIAMDAGHPEARLQAIVEQAYSESKRRFILSSVANRDLSFKLTQSLTSKGQAVVMIAETIAQEQIDLSRLDAVEVQPDDNVYIVFTSGSTGTPKGAMISHRNLCTAIHYQAPKHMLDSSSRVFDYPSYAFDAAWSTSMHTLCVGACLCIPKDEDRLNNPAEAIRSLEANWLSLTPTVWRLVRPHPLPPIRTLLLVGEPLRNSDIEQDTSKVEFMFNAYGPAECTIESTIGPISSQDSVLNNIGFGCGLVTWIMSTHSSKPTPAAVGEVGELWLEGPLVGQGYLGNREKTKEAFIEDPVWLLQGGSGVAGRRGRLYRTGDLVRYSSNGSLQFIGRKDDQVKIRGQRVELGDVETHVKQLLAASFIEAQVAAEVIQPRHYPNNVLVVFINQTSENLQDIVKVIARFLNDKLLLRLPRHMIPSAYIPIATLPTTLTGKIDRKALREIGEEIDLARLARDGDTQHKAPSSQMESLLVQIWMEVLGMPADRISVDVPFTRLGGDSITAMQVVSRLRTQQVQLATAEILRHQTIDVIATKCQIVVHANLHQGDVEVVNEAWGLSPIQEMFFAAHPDGLDHFNQSFLLQLQEQFSAEQVHKAATSLVSRHPMLRARFGRNSSGAWEQHTVKNDAHAFLFETHDHISHGDMSRKVQTRQRSLSIIDGPVFSVDYFRAADSMVYVLFTAHHLVIDLVSWRIIWRDMEQLLKEPSLPDPAGASFRRWAHMQKAFAQKENDSVSSLPFQLIDMPEFWGVSPSENTIGNIEDFQVRLDAATTDRLLGDCNSSLRTQPVDVMVAALIHSLHDIFPERPAPAIFVEGHGRETLGEASIDLSETVGWFTSLCPVQVSLQQESTIFDTVRLVKDVRRSILGNGLPYFASQYREVTKHPHHNHVEFLFNYGGVFQQLEGRQSVFQRVDVDIEEVSPLMKRMALVEINGSVVEGMLCMTVSIHRGMKHYQLLTKWACGLENVFRSATGTLAAAPLTATLSDFPLLPATYSELNNLITRLAEIGVHSEDIVDLLPCTPLQEGILFGIAKGSASYHIVQVWECKALDYKVPIDAQKLRSAWQNAVGRHSIFSTIFVEPAELQAYVQVQLRRKPVHIHYFQSDLDSATEALERMDKPTFSDTKAQFSVAVCQASNGAVACRLDISHALIDAMSFPILLNDVADAYEQGLGRQAASCFQIAPGFPGAVKEIMRTPPQSKWDYWSRYLAGIEPCRIPVRSIPADAEGRHQDIILPKSVTDRISACCQANDITRSTFLQVAWAMVISQITHREDVCFGYLASGRDINVEGVDDIVGPFINTLISRINLGAPATTVLKETGQHLVNHFDFQHVSLARLQGSLGLRGEQLFNTALTVRQSLNIHRGDHQLVFQEGFGQDPNEVCNMLCYTSSYCFAY